MFIYINTLTNPLSHPLSWMWSFPFQSYQRVQNLFQGRNEVQVQHSQLSQHLELFEKVPQNVQTP
jgi:hypothetical protein